MQTFEPIKSFFQLLDVPRKIVGTVYLRLRNGKLEWASSIEPKTGIFISVDGNYPILEMKTYAQWLIDGTGYWAVTFLDYTPPVLVELTGGGAVFEISPALSGINQIHNLAGTSATMEFMALIPVMTKEIPNISIANPIELTAVPASALGVSNLVGVSVPIELLSTVVSIESAAPGMIQLLVIPSPMELTTALSQNDLIHDHYSVANPITLTATVLPIAQDQSLVDTTADLSFTPVILPLDQGSALVGLYSAMELVAQTGSQVTIVSGIQLVASPVAMELTPFLIPVLDANLLLGISVPMELVAQTGSQADSGVAGLAITLLGTSVVMELIAQTGSQVNSAYTSVPTTVAGVSVSQVGSDLVVSWTGNPSNQNIANYIVYVATGYDPTKVSYDGAWTVGTVTTYTFNFAMTVGTSYRFMVVAANSYGQSGASAVAAITYQTPVVGDYSDFYMSSTTPLMAAPHGQNGWYDFALLSGFQSALWHDTSGPDTNTGYVDCFYYYDSDTESDSIGFIAKGIVVHAGKTITFKAKGNQQPAIWAHDGSWVDVFPSPAISSTVWQTYTRIVTNSGYPAIGVGGSDPVTGGWVRISEILIDTSA